MKLANLQYTAGPTEAASLKIITPLISEAAAKGADIIALPECATVMMHDQKKFKAEAPDEATSPGLAALCAEAGRHDVWLLVGSLLLKDSANDNDKMVNRSFLIAPDGTITARYDKIHMFDADPGDGTSYRESEHYTPGTRAVLAETPLCKIGMTICYDMRFAHLYRRLAVAGAQLITVPAAFTRPTGAAHWHTLLRARAIETGCFIMAPAQTGTHDGGRRTWGHSLIIGPWGEVLADAGEDPQTVSMAEINLDAIRDARRRIPAIGNARDFDLD